jgi:bile acid-coenzyme A ligase
VNAPPLGDLLLEHALRKDVNAVALTYPGVSVTWSELEAHANHKATQYRAMGVCRNDMVGIALNNCPAFHAAVFAVWKLGATPTIISPRLPASEFSTILEIVQPKLVVADPAVTQCGDSCWLTAESPERASQGTPFPSEVATHWKALCSGGSTGRPKVIVDHAPAQLGPAIAGLCAVAQLPADGVMLNPGPLYHNGPFLFTSLALFTGCSVVGMERFDAEEALRLIEANRVGWVCLVPTMMHRIWSLPREVRERYDLSSLRTIWHMAAPCPPWLKQAWINWLGPERIWEAYAGTEGFGVTAIRGDEWLRRPGSVGRILGSGKVKAVREDATDCATGEVGELYFLPADRSAPSHYLGAEVKGDAAGWLSIGDLGYLDADGYVFLTDRRTDLILRGGANVYPAEVEAAIEAHPAVASSIVVGLPCEEMGARVHAIVEAKAGAAIDKQALHEFLATQLAKYKLPESYELVSHPLRDEAGKVRRAALRDERVRWLKEGRTFKLVLRPTNPGAAHAARGQE